jgi:hypothetical protein
MVLALRTPQQVKCPEALDLVEMRLTCHPQIFKALRSSLMTLKRFMAMNIDFAEVWFSSPDFNYTNCVARNS